MKSNKMVPVVTIDGPSGTGKGTICRMLAAHLNWQMLDSGSIYRVLAYAARKRGLSLDDIMALVSLANKLDVYFQADPQQQGNIMLDGEEVSSMLRSEQCGQDASIIAVIPEVRQALLERQRAFAKPPGLVTDGRDMGTVVFPDAVLKIYLDATSEERAARRYFQLKEKGIDVSLAQVVEELAKRDARDTARLFAPLKPAADAVIIDTTGLKVVQVFNNVLKLLEHHSFFR